MMMKVLSVTALLSLVVLTNSFAPIPHRCHGKRNVVVEVGSSEDVVGRLSESVDALRTNLQKTFQEDSASDQALILSQGALILLLVFGTVPIIGGLLDIVCGPGLLLAGVALLGSGVLELGPKNLTPSINPVQENELKTNGVFAISRHPIYTGVLTAAMGLAVTTQSFQRIIIVGLLYLLLDFKASKEEEALVAIHPAYGAYQSTVPKLLPDLQKLFTDDD